MSTESRARGRPAVTIVKEDGFYQDFVESELSTLTDLNTAVKPEVIVGIEGDVSLVPSVGDVPF